MRGGCLDMLDPARRRNPTGIVFHSRIRPSAAGELGERFQQPGALEVAAPVAGMVVDQ